jgi:hypothetical protein
VLGVVVELVAQTADVDVDRPVEDLGGVVGVDRVEELVAGQDPAVRGEQGGEQAELDEGQGNEAGADARLVAGRVEDEVAVAERPLSAPRSGRSRPGRRRVRAGRGGLGPAKDRLDTQDELARRERLDEVVVRAVLEAADPTRIGIVADTSSRRTARITARPSSSGSIRSSTTRAGSWRSIAARADGPSPAVSTTYPSRSRYVRTRRTILGSSSTTRIGRRVADGIVRSRWYGGGGDGAVTARPPPPPRRAGAARGCCNPTNDDAEPPARRAVRRWSL